MKDEVKTTNTNKCAKHLTFFSPSNSIVLTCANYSYPISSFDISWWCFVFQLSQVSQLGFAILYVFAMVKNDIVFVENVNGVDDEVAYEHEPGC